MNCDEIVSGLILEFRRGTLIMVVLAQLNKPMYGYSLVKELEGKGISIEGNTLYPLLRRLESQGLLKSEWETEATKPRKYYIITEDGKLVYKKIKEHWKKFSQSINVLMEEEQMVKNDLIDRYIYAVTKHMKSAMKKDVAAELETIIQDMLEERCEDVTPTERDIKVVLTELGTPNELASKYKGETQDCLIGQPYYSLYVYVLKIVTVCISGGMLLAQIMAALTSHTIWYIAIYRTIGGIFGGILTGFAFVTLLFAFFYKKGIKVDGLNDGIDNLPPVPQKTNRISKANAIVGIAFSVIFTLIFLVCPQIICIAFVKNGAGVYEPLFNLEYIRQTWYFILAFGILGVARESVRLIDGSYTKRVMLVTIITNLIDGALTIIWLLNDKIMNPNFFEGIEQLFGENTEVISQVFIQFNKVFLAIIIFALGINCIETVIKALKYSRK